MNSTQPIQNSLIRNKSESNTIDRCPKIDSLDFNSRLQNSVVNTQNTIRPRSVTKNSARHGQDRSKDLGLDNKRKLREYDILTKKLHEANSAMKVMEKTIHDQKEAQENISKDILFYRNKNNDLMQEVQFANEKVLKEKDLYQQLKDEFQIKFNHCQKKEQKLKHLTARLENELRSNFKTCFDMNNFINYLQSRLDTAISLIMKSEHIDKFDKHPFDEHNKCVPVDFERTQKDLELIFDFYNQKVKDVEKVQQQFDGQINEIKSQNNFIHELRNEIELTKEEFIKFKKNDFDQAIKKSDILEQQNNQLQKQNEEISTVVNQIQIKQKQKLAQEEDVSTSEIIKKVLETELISKTLNDRFINLANQVQNYSKYQKFDLDESDEMQFKNQDIGRDQKEKFKNQAEVDMDTLKKSYNLLLRNIKTLIDLQFGHHPNPNYAITVNTSKVTSSEVRDDQNELNPFTYQPSNLPLSSNRNYEAKYKLENASNADKDKKTTQESLNNNELHVANSLDQDNVPTQANAQFKNHTNAPSNERVVMKSSAEFVKSLGKIEETSCGLLNQKRAESQRQAEQQERDETRELFDKQLYKNKKSARFSENRKDEKSKINNDSNIIKKE